MKGKFEKSSVFTKIIVFCSIFLVVGILAVVVSITTLFIEDITSKILLETISNILLFLLVPFLFIYFSYSGKPILFFKFKKIHSRPLFYIVLLYVLYFPIISYLVELNQMIPKPKWLDFLETNQDTAFQLMMSNSLPQLFFKILIGAVVPGIIEEIMFRGFIMNIFAKRYNVYIAIGLSSFIFSIIHLAFNALIPIFIMGFLLGYIYHITKNIWYPIILHFLNNGITVVLLYIFGKEEIMESEGQPIYVVILAVVLFLIALKYKGKFINLRTN